MEIKELIQALAAASDEEKKQFSKILEPYWEENAKRVLEYANNAYSRRYNHGQSYDACGYNLYSWLHTNEFTKESIKKSIDSSDKHQNSTIFVDTVSVVKNNCTYPLQRQEVCEWCPAKNKCNISKS